jgi:hypothetical protein
MILFAFVLLVCTCIGLMWHLMRVSDHKPGDILVQGIADEAHITQNRVYDTADEHNNLKAVHLEIDAPDIPFDVLFEEDEKAGILRAKGSGLVEFTNIDITHGKHTASTKADWAGLFDIRLPLHVIDPDKPIEFAFSGHHDIVGHDANTFAPLGVHVFWAPGGGGPGSDGVNEYDNPFCGDPPLSTCVDSRMKAQNKAMEDNYDTALMMMGEQLSVVMHQYVQIIGSFLDAKSQMDTQRVYQRLTAQAHKDYHPSEQMCRFGSYIKSVADVDRNAAQTKQAINKALMESYKGVQYNSTGESVGLDMKSRIKQYRQIYCDPADNNNGMKAMCGNGGKKQRMNKDIDFTRTANFPLSLDIDFTNGNDTKDEEDVLALATNLYWPSAMNHAHEKGIARDPIRYMDLRRLYALNNVAHNSFAHYIGMKAEGPNDSSDGGGRYMRAFLKELGMSYTDARELLGGSPSYYAQMEVLTKKIYQSPHFYTNLYDKPANVKRIGVTLDAIKLMQMRDLQEASMRREMLTSALIEEALTEPINKINTAIGPAVTDRLSR